MARFDYTKYLKEGGVEKYLMEADFGNDLQSRYDYVRPLMSRLPDTAYTESLIDGMEDGLRTDDKVMFDFYFVETMKALGLEDELMEAEDSLINPEAEEIEDDDLAAAADYYDSLAENDNILDEFLEMPAEEEEEEGEDEVEITINMAENKNMLTPGDKVFFRTDTGMEKPMKVVKVRRMLGTNFLAATVEDMDGKIVGEYDDTQLIKFPEKKIFNPEEKANVFVREDELEEIDVKGQVQTEEVSLKPGMVQKGNVVDAIKLLNHIQYEYADAFSEDSMDKVSDVIVMLNQIMKQK
tara:strand:- start:271 stop:1158 length:888 start_codon:yes stop_codon:yes gene_type:complete